MRVANQSFTVIASAFLLFSFWPPALGQNPSYNQTPIQKRCSEEADARGLHGIERKNFREQCKQNAAQSPEPATTALPKQTVATPAAPPPPKQLTTKPVTAPRIPTATSLVPPLASLSNPISSAAAPIAETRVALVIGNSAYKNVPFLPNPANDANDISESLKQLGFTVHTLTNANFDEMRRNVIAFGRDTQGSGIAVIFFAGHGMEVGGENWLIPVDAELLSDTDAENEAISLKAAMLQVTKATKLGLVILDACRNNPFAAKMQRTVRVRSVDRGFVRTEPLDNVLVAYSAKDGTTARDGSGRNSPFTSALLRYIQTPGLEVRFLFANVRDDVMAATNREQQPFVYGSLSSERIYFRMPDGTQSPEATKPFTVPKIVTKPAPIVVAKPVEVRKQTETGNAVGAPTATALVLPNSVSPKYSSETDGKARMFTCVDQYNANKETNSNGGMKWIEQGGGYYSVCNQHLKN